MFAKIEEDLYKALNSLGIGILDAGGDTSVLAVNVEYAYTHIAGIAVATSTNCMVARRASSRIDANGQVSIMKSPNWFGNRNVLIHNGPIVVKENGKWRLVSFMPTSSIRFEKWGAKSVENWGLKMIIGKTTMGEQTAQMTKEKTRP